MKDSSPRVQKKKTNGKPTSIAYGPPTSTPPSPPRSQVPPQFRLTSTKSMDASDQQRFELLLNLLIERRAARLLERSHD